jgi:hypothetical protein
MVPEEKVGRNTAVEVDGTCNATKLSNKWDEG